MRSLVDSLISISHYTQTTRTSREVASEDGGYEYLRYTHASPSNP